MRRGDPAIEIYRLGAFLFAYGAFGFAVDEDFRRLLAGNLLDALWAPRYTEGQRP